MPQLILNFIDIPIPETCLWEQRGGAPGTDSFSADVIKFVLIFASLQIKREVLRIIRA